MKLTAKNGQTFQVREYEATDFETIHELNKDEHWTNLAEKKAQTKIAWDNSNVTYVVIDEEKVIGCVRGMTDGGVTTFICELLISRDYRGLGIGTELLKLIHGLVPETRLDLLATSTSQSYYEKSGFRPFYGYRKTIAEWGEA